MSKNNAIKKSTIEPINRDKAVLQMRLLKLIENGRKFIKTKVELEEYPMGSLVSYMNTQGIFRTAGFIDKFENDSFIFMDPDFKTRMRVRYANVKKMWVGKVHETKNDIVSIVTSPNTKTNKFVTVGDVVVYYAKDAYTVNRFKLTEKYKRMVKWYERYHDAE